MTSIKKYLLKGIPKRNTDTQKLEIYSYDLNTLIYMNDFVQLSTADIGYAYERHVGLHYEKLGYKVEYRGMEKGFLDQGIDLICYNAKDILCIQCKYRNRAFSTQDIEWILYKSSSFFVKNLKKFDTKPTFIIMVPKLNIAFYPKLTEYILSKNYTQNYVRIALKELDF